MNKILSIIMLLSCVGNVFSMGGGAAAGGGFDDELQRALAASMDPRSNVNPADYDSTLALALAASAALGDQNQAAQNTEDLELQQALADVENFKVETAQLEQEFEARAEQGEFVQEVAVPETITVNGREYTIHQLQTIGQSKVTGRCSGDMSCFGQSVKNAAAMIDWLDTRDDSALAPLVRLPAARAKLKEINRLLDDTRFPLGSRTHEQLKDANGFYHDVSVEEGSALFDQHQTHDVQDILRFQIVINRDFFDRLANQDFDISTGLGMLQEDSSRFFEFCQFSRNTLDGIDAWRSGSINILGIVLQTEGHYIAIVFERYQGETNIWVSDSKFGGSRLHNQWSKNYLLVPLINFVENFDIKPWLEQLSSIRDAKQRAEQTEQAEQGGGFSLFDSGFEASSLVTQAQSKLQSHIARFGGINNANEAQGGRTPLIAAVEANDYDLALDLYRAGADINGVATGEHAGKNALFFAANWGRLDLVKLLLYRTISLDAALQAAKANLGITIDRGENIPGAGSMQDYIDIIELINVAEDE